MGKGLDIGTGNIVSAVQTTENTIIYRSERDAFIYLGNDESIFSVILRSNIPYVKINNSYYMVGNDAYQHASIFKDIVLRRPMAKGLLNPSEKDEAFIIINEIIKTVLGKPSNENEICVFITPGTPINSKSRTIYHEETLKNMIERLGYTPVNLNEGVALGYAGLVDEQLTGIAISFGCGMANIAVMYHGLAPLVFSVSESGDYIDINAARDTGNSVSKITHIKESNEFNLMDKNGSREVLAIISYYKFIIKNILAQIANKFSTSAGMPEFSEPIKIVCGGGTSMVPGFIDFFKQEYEVFNFPINIKGIELVQDPLTAVARGALSEAILRETKQ